MGFQLTKKSYKKLFFCFFKIICYNIIRDVEEGCDVNLSKKRILSIGDIHG